MQLLKHWRGEGSRKRAAGESNQESMRKRMKEDDGKRESTGTATGNETATAAAIEGDQEHKIRGASNMNGDLFHSSSSPFPNQSTHFPVATEALSSIHPDRRDNIFNTTRIPTSAPASSLTTRQSPLSAISPSPEHISKVEPEEQRPKPLHSTSSPSLRPDTVRTSSSLDPPSPDRTSNRASHWDGKSRDSPSHDPRIYSLDSYRSHNSNPPSRGQSDAMPPPANVAKIPRSEKTTRSENSTPKFTSPPVNSELDCRQPSTIQPPVTLLDSLNAFAQSITSAASLTVRRDLAKQQVVGQQKERDRQAKFKSTFLTLIEDAESRVEGVEKVSVEIEKRIDWSSQAQSKNAIALAAQLLKQAEVSTTLSSAQERALVKDDFTTIKADLEIPKNEIGNTRDRGHSEDDIAELQDDISDLKADLKAAGKRIDSLDHEAIMPYELNRKLRGLATKAELEDLVAKDEIQGLVSKNELRRVTTDEVRKHVTEALVPTERTLASLISEDASLNRKIKDVEALTGKHCKTAEEKDQEHSSQFRRLDTSLRKLQLELSRLELRVQEQKEDCAAVKVKIGAQNKVLTDLSNCVRLDATDNASSLDNIVMRNSDQIDSLQQDCEKLNEAIRHIQDAKAASNLEPPQVSMATVNADAEYKEEVKLIQSSLDALRAEQEDFKLIRHNLDALKADREVVLIRADLDSLIREERLKDVGVAEGFEAIEASIKKQEDQLAQLQTEVRLAKQSQASQTVPNHPPTPPFANASMSPRISDQQKLQDVEMGLRSLTKTIQGLELFVNSQQQKFDGLTSDRVVQSMVHQMQQMYPQHPGNIAAWQNKVDTYLTVNLKDRLAKMDSQIVAQITARMGADSKTQNEMQAISQFTAETRTFCLATINSIKQEIKNLKDTASDNRAQGHSDYGNRIDGLVDRVTNVEARYVEAISDLQKTQTDLARSVTHLQHRNGIGSVRNTPRELTSMSRSSKSVERTGNASVSLGNSDESDSSDTPLSQRAGRRDEEDRRPSDLNLKRKAAESDDDDEDEDEDEGGEDRPTNPRKVPKRWNVSGQNPFS